MLATYNSSAHPLPSAPVGGASMQPPPSQPQSTTTTSKATNNTSQQRNAASTTTTTTTNKASHSRTASMARGDRRSRGLSFRSDKSGHSGVSTKLEPETHAEKESRRLHTKADPTLAIFEAEPSAIAATEQTSLAPLRSIVHRDSYGNPISEPDRSNPTRYRWERPLDTIRSFEAAIDGGYSRKPQGETENMSITNTGFSRRNSQFSVQGANGNNQPNAGGARYPQDSYYRGQQQPYVTSSSSNYDLRQTLHGRDSYYDYQGAPPQPQHLQGRQQQRMSRVSSENQIHGNGYLNRPDQQQAVYPGGNANHRSYETVASGSGSNGEPAGYQTDPTSSDNSSIERRQSPGKMGMGGPGGPGQFNRRPSPMNDLSNGGYGYNNNNSGYNGPKAPQIQLNGPGGASVPAAAAAGQPITANVITRKATNPSAAAAPSKSTPPADKRKSWLSRKFSKKA